MVTPILGVTTKKSGRGGNTGVTGKRGTGRLQGVKGTGVKGKRF